jgi:tRNA A-37 threonylcarbamoyl transferase component Bud32
MFAEAMFELVPLSYPGTNLIYILRSEPPRIVKVFLPKVREGKWKLFRYRLLSAIGYPTPMAYRGSAERCIYERHVLEYWAAAGYRVPRVLRQVEISRPTPPNEYLVLEFIAGATLFEELSDFTKSEECKISMLERLFSEMAIRHRSSLNTRDPLLVQYNPNLRNIIVSGDDFYHIDFEVRRWLEPLVKSIAREVVTLATQSVNAIGPSSLFAVASVIFRSYGKGEILERITGDSTMNVWRKKKKRKETAVTRHDVAAAILQIESDQSDRTLDNRNSSDVR